MKTKFIVASSIGLLGVASMIIGATTFASTTGAKNLGGYGSGVKMMGNRNGMMKQFTNTGEAEAFRTAVENAMSNKDFAAFKAVHTKYGITLNITQDQFNDMISKKATQEKIQTALIDGDYATWKTLNKDNPILGNINTEAKFKQLQEMHTYQEKARSIAETLGLGGSKGTGMGMGMGMNDGPKGMGQGKGVHMGKGTGPRNGS